MNAQHHELGEGWQSSSFSAPSESLVARTLAAALADTAAARPQASAVIDRGLHVSFAELTQRVGGLAAQIGDAVAQPGPVALLQSVGVDVVAAWFACALAGRPFLLLETTNPPERNRALMIRAGVRILLTDRAPDPVMVADIDGVVLVQPEGRVASLQPNLGLGVDEPTMIFPTSGSTGESKLITYSARTLQSKMQASIPLMGAQAGDRVLIAGSHSNYGFLHHALLFVLAGGTLCLVDVRVQGLAAVFDAILTHRVRHVRFTPSLFRVAASNPDARPALQLLRGVRFSGEPLLSADLELARQVLSPDCRIQNVYGSTESALFIWTDDRARTVEPGTVPIGRIYPFWEYAIRDDDGVPVPPGELGALIISAPCQALGDWQDGVVDGGRFPPDPRGGPCRLYDTGDVVRQGPDGTLTVAGRKDRLVKINGLRVSLDEIESHLQAMPGCAQAAVQELAGRSGNRLVAFLVKAQGVEATESPQAWMSRRLPRHMIPARLHWVDAMPLLPGGKIDRKALLAGLPAEEEVIEVAESDDPIQALITLWRRILKLPSCGLDADFFSLGGDSLLMLELQLAVEQRFSRGFTTDDFIARPTLRGLAALLGLGPMGELSPLQRGEVEINFRVVRLAQGARRGVALCMPGFWGAANQDFLTQSPLLTDFDLWACDARFESGTMLSFHHWVTTAFLIAEQIVEGRAVKPDLVVGFSIAGYIAWLVTRLLAGTAVQPERVVAIDSIPLHRLRGYRTWRFRSVRLQDAFVRTAGSDPVEFLNVQCDMPAPFQIRHQPSHLWQADDGRITTIRVQTLEHGDIGKSAALKQMASAVSRYVEGGASAVQPNTSIAGVDSFSGAAHDLLRTAADPDLHQLNEILAQPQAFIGQTVPSALLFLTLAYAPWARAQVFCVEVLRMHPGLAAGYYAKMLLAVLPQASPSQQASMRADMLSARHVDLHSFAAIDLALSLRLGAFSIGSLPVRTLARVLAVVATLGHRSRSGLRRLGDWF